MIKLIFLDGLSYKQKKELKTKVTAGSSHNWNTLFLGHNAVADAMANAYNTTKEKVNLTKFILKFFHYKIIVFNFCLFINFFIMQVLDDNGSSSVAVRLALGETQLVQETQKFLEKNGVHLNAFNQVVNLVT